MSAADPGRCGPRKRRSAQAGFTLMELLVVVAVVGILAAIVVPQFKNAPQKAREAVLKTNLHTMREAFDQYFADKAHYPESLETLVEEGYLRSVPKDPFTSSTTTWVFTQAETGEDSLPEELESAAGIFDVHSGSTQVALDGTSVSEW